MDGATITTTPEVLDLPFVRETDDGEVFLWHPRPTGDRQADIAAGEHYARLTMFVAREFGVPLLLASVLRDMTLAGKFGGVEAGFIAAVTSVAQVGSLN
ncbi:hypothetical protein ACM41_26415 [Bradyrhizobium sp. CCBAU 21362]|uniref:hypothetical protein n=1 Tax=Bradyrhizobium sp. CCBAU 21362 TaxID=1325082 RepID=UPI0023069C17|nr:hypothetical protein [Bradyrhizobium sp. CCBAU 21362]MDA9539637.1 hypothetical protein [Bradyrhizobium sp. CCBAU 21362]